MALRLGGLADLDPMAVPLPLGTEVTTRVDRTVHGAPRPQGATGRVAAVDGDRVEVQFVDGKRATYLRAEVAPRKLGVQRYAQRRAVAWDALRPCVVIDTLVGSRAWGVSDERSDEEFVLMGEDTLRGTRLQRAAGRSERSAHLPQLGVAQALRLLRERVVVRPHRPRRGDLGHPVLEDHRPGEIGHALEVVRGPVRDPPEHDLLGGPAAEVHHHQVEELLACGRNRHASLRRLSVPSST